jgi:hypothetical protein
VEGNVGPATLKAWGGKLKKQTIPVGWVQIGKAYVSYHLMGVYGNPKLLEGMSKELKARMQGKTCFNFKSVDEALLKELDSLTAQAFAAFRKAGYISDVTKNLGRTNNFHDSIWYQAGLFFSAHHTDWRPFGPKRRRRHELQTAFAPELREKAYDQEIGTKIPFPIGPKVQFQNLWFRRV